METTPSAPPTDFLEVKIPVLLIETKSFTKVDGYIDDDTWDIKFKASNKDSTSILSVEVTLKCLVDDNLHAVHISKTLFAIQDLSLANLQAGDNRLELLCELGLSAIGHARALFFQLTRDFNIPPFVMVFTNDIRKVVARQVNSIV